VKISQPRPEEVSDRRVRRSRSALMGAALALVAERGTANVAISDIAEAADVSRQLVYQQFGDRDALLLETALDLVRRDLLPRIAHGGDAPGGRDRVLAAARHFAEHRSFYRAMMTGSCGFELTRALSGLLSPVNRPVARLMSRVPLEPDMEADLAVFVTGGWAALISTWVIDGQDPLDPEALADRLLRIVPAIVGGGATAWLSARG
jgi:AcrR family transcriptional regulator